MSWAEALARSQVERELREAVQAMKAEQIRLTLERR